MHPKPPRSPVRILAAGALLSLGAASCHKDVVTSNSPPPDPVPTTNPPPTPPALPAWEDVASGHPEGATNPPMPVLEVTEDGQRCFKAWQSPMVPDPDLRALNGRVLATADAAKGVEIQCPPEERDRLLAAWKAQQAGEKAPSEPSDQH
jgi:hypothetical protein